MSKLRTATIKKTGKKIQVYLRNSTGGWLDISDCKTEYTKKELIFN